MKTKVFISRQLDADSPFREALKDDAYVIEDQVLFIFSPIDFEQAFTKWLFFYSKTGIDYFINKGGNTLLKKVGTFGQQTARHFHRMTNVEADFIGSGEKNHVAAEFSNVLKTNSCLFVVGKNSLRSVQQIRANTDDQEVIVYDNSPLSTFKISYPDVAVFTSPMAVRTYFKAYPDRDHLNIAIGQTTLNSLFQIGKKNSLKSDQPSEISLAQKVIQATQKG